MERDQDLNKMFRITLCDEVETPNRRGKWENLLYRLGINELKKRGGNVERRDLRRR